MQAHMQPPTPSDHIILRAKDIVSSATALRAAGLVQGLGEGPDRILVGTESGSICMWECREDAEEVPICWLLGDHACPGVEVTCLAATDQVVINGFADGAMRIMRVDSPSVQHDI